MACWREAADDRWNGMARLLTERRLGTFVHLDGEDEQWRSSVDGVKYIRDVARCRVRDRWI